MTRILLSLAVCALALASVAHASETVDDDLGTLNPDDTGKDMIVRKIEMGVVDSITCSLGINVTKNVDLELSRKLTRRCAEAGLTKAMTWMSQMENNGMGGDYNPDASAEWDQRAAEAGDPVGKFNHGLNLIRGHGIAQDGLPVAQRLQQADYDLDEVTPDADNWKYAPMF